MSGRFSRTIYVGNLPADIRESKVEDLFYKVDKKQKTVMKSSLWMQKELNCARKDATSLKMTYGSVIKLMHERTKFRLHTYDVPYGSGSGQQSVTGFPNVDEIIAL